MNAKSYPTDDGRVDVECDDQDLRLTAILEDYLADLERGAAPDRQTLLAQHPDLSAQLATCLNSLDVAQRIGVQFRDDAAGGVPHSPARIPAQLGDFRIRREIGRGGMGIVYEAEQLSMSRKVALKILPLAALIDAKGLARFRNEVRAAGALDHPHVIHIYSVGEEHGVHYFAMQLIPGQSLAQVIEQLRLTGPERGADSIAAAVHSSTACSGVQRGEDPKTASVVADRAEQAEAPTLAARDDETPVNRKPLFGDFCRSVAQLGVHAAEALHHAHEHGIVHRDVKPSNLLVDGAGRLWVTDFGLARIEADTRLTRSRDWVGTLRYMAPEQTLGNKAKVDHRVDVYALGATLYELLVLRPARDGDDREEMLKQSAASQPVPL